MDSLAFLERGARAKLQPIYVLAGNEDFLKRQVRAVLKQHVLGEGNDDFGFSGYAGEQANWSTIRDELDTLPFLGSRRLVVIENADSFVTQHREALEKYVGQPSATGVLSLEVKTWMASTRLAKLIPEAATLDCKTPAVAKLTTWCVQWAARFGKQLTKPAAQLLVELIGADMGQLDQELTKLAVYVGEAARIDAPDVDLLVGRSHAANTFRIFDAIGNGQPDEALTILDQLFDMGEEPLRILGAFSFQLRRLAQAARLHQQGVPLGAALTASGVQPFAVRGCEQQLRHLGRRRVDHLYDWLLEIDLGMKGSSALPPRTLLERLVIRLARPRDAEPAPTNPERRRG